MKKLLLNDKFILVLISINALLIFFQEFNISINFLDYFETLFTFLFVIEMCLKIKTFGFKKYISDKWNFFDFIIIIVSIPSLAVLFNGNIFLKLNFLLVFRALRIFKFFRIVRFFPNIGAVVKSIQRALKASYVVIAGFFLLIFITSIITCSIYKNIAPEYFSNPFKSFYSIFRLFSTEGWYEIPDLIALRTNSIIGFFSTLYFIIMLLLGGIIGLSLVNSIFVDAMVADNNDNLEKEVKDLTEKIDKLSQKMDKIAEKNS